jgi:hypothetical protein
MKKIIWLLWLQGWSEAPRLARACLSSWQKYNSDWEIRAISLDEIRILIELPDLSGVKITPASFSDFVRLRLLKEYGGIWVDATVLCRRPLDSWIWPFLIEGFFAFAKPCEGRELSSWFLAADRPCHPVVSAWDESVRAYWRHRSQASDYFWLHNLFASLCESNYDVKQAWDRVPKYSANSSHRAQVLGLDNDDDEAFAELESESSPVLKLTHRIDSALLERDCLLSRLLRGLPEPLLPLSKSIQQSSHEFGDHQIAGLTVSTENLGDHIQLSAANSLLRRLWSSPSVFVDRDHQIASLEGCPEVDRRKLIVMNGWFKFNRLGWPPHPSLLPAYVGFHLRPFQCPELLSAAAIRHYRQYSPIGCRDSWTCELLRAHGVEAYVSNCLSLALPTRSRSLVPASEVFVVSRDRQICDYIPQGLGPYEFVSHYSGSKDVCLNLARADHLLSLYAGRAKLIVTTLLHCALPALAMGIPVVMVWPIGSAVNRLSDRQRFSSLLSLIKVHEPEELEAVDWNVQAVNCVAEKLAALDGFVAATLRWNLPYRPLGWELAPASVLPPPGGL